MSDQQTDPEPVTPDAEPSEPPRPDETERHGPDLEPEPEGEGEPEGEQLAQQGESPEEWEKRFRAADKAFETYRRKVVSIYGDAADQLIPVATSPSAPPGFLFAADAGNVPPEIKEPILVFFGLTREVEYRPDPDTETCPVCQGEGKVLTGSSVPDKRVHGCRRCQSRGFIDHGATGPAEPTNGHVEAGYTQVAPITGPTEEVDRWGEPRLLPDGRENPNFGRMPDYKVAVEGYGRTADLAAVTEQPA